MIEKIAVFCKNLLDWFKSDRCFVSPFIKAFPLANNLLLITLGLFLATFNTLYFAVSMRIGVNLLIAVFILAFLSSAVASGFCQVVKQSVQEYDENEDFKNYDVKTTFEIFYTGVGRRYLQFFGGFMLFFVIIIAGMMLSMILATKFICPLSSIGLDLDTLQMVMANQNALTEFASQMTKSQVLHLLVLFYITNVITPFIMGYFLMLWIPEFMYSGKNVVVSLFTSIKKLFSDFWNTLCIYILIVLGHIFIAFAFALLPQTSIMLYISSLIFIYWVIYNFFTIFIYYKNRGKYTGE